MNILFLIGNGFDLNLGMKTRYSDFYAYYSSIPSSSVLIKKLKDEIDSNIENWSDLELALGKYTNELHTSSEFNEVFEDIEDNLATYLNSVENTFEFQQFNGKEFYKNLAFPENSLLPADKIRLVDFKNRWNSSQWNINLITFNYTNSLEKLLEFSGKPLDIKDFVRRSPHSVVIHKIEHIHGYYYQRMVLGVNDISQVSNKNFHNNQDIIETLIKNECNKAQKHTIDIWCKDQIMNANLICIFGSSIGDTDNIWWQLIGEQLKRDCVLIIFERGELIPPLRPQKGTIAERKKKKYFLGKTNLTDKEKEVAIEKIFVGVNTNMFMPALKKE
jgi:hypothetical protein